MPRAPVTAGRLPGSRLSARRASQAGSARQRAAEHLGRRLRTLYRRIEFDERDNIFVGRVLGLHTMISFHGETVAELRSEFETAIEEFLRDCKEQGVRPEKPASGKLMLRVPPEVHGAALVAAKAAGKSLNQWATEVLEEASQG